MAMFGMILGNLTNIILDPVMILGLKWDVAGAAAATVIGNVASAVFYIVHLIGKNTLLTISPKMYKVSGGIAAGVLAIGVPAALNNILMSTSNIMVNNLMTKYGDMAVAGLGVSIKVNMVAATVILSTPVPSPRWRIRRTGP